MKHNKNNHQCEGHRGHLVTVLLQDYFHRGVFKQVIGEKQWSRFESRLDSDVENTLKLFREFNIQATFFALGWIADNYPGIIRKIISEGHEIANAGYWARSVREVTPQLFREDLRRSKKALEGAGANKIIGHRCAFKWIRKEDIWALDILAEEGYLYDASYRPAWINIKEKPSSKFAHEYHNETLSIWEFPTSTSLILGLNIPISGGSYIRQIPHFFMFHCFRDWCKETEAPFVLYFHPWELGIQQPEITAVGRLSKIRQYRNLGNMQWILPKYFESAKFQTISQYLNIPLEYPDTSVSRLPPPTFDFMPDTPVSRLQPTTFNLMQGSFSLTPEARGLTPVTIVIPCYNEISSLPYLAKALEELRLKAKKNYDFKFIFVDDNSSDGTYVSLQSIFGRKKDCMIIRQKINQGVAAAIQTGLTEAQTDVVCSIDADCSYDPIVLLKMIPMLEKGFDMVTASPYHPDGTVFGVPEWRLHLSKSLSKLYHIVLNNKLSTYTSCFRVYRRRSILSINYLYGDFRGIVELLARLDIMGGTIREYPTMLQCRIFGHSKMKVYKTIFSHIKLLVEIIWFNHQHSLRAIANKAKQGDI